MTVVNARIAADAERLYNERLQKDPQVQAFFARLAEGPVRIQTLGIVDHRRVSR